MIAVQFGCEELKYDFYKRFKDLIDWTYNTISGRGYQTLQYSEFLYASDGNQVILRANVWWSANLSAVAHGHVHGWVMLLWTEIFDVLQIRHGRPIVFFLLGRPIVFFLLKSLMYYKSVMVDQ